MLIATGISYTLGVLHSSLTLWIYASNGRAVETWYATFGASPFHNLFAHCINVAAAAFGGYWAAKHASGRPFFYAAIAGALMLFPVCLVIFVPYELPQPVWSRWLFFLTPVPAAMLGALYRAMTG
jgi:hypothetical protein